MELAPQIVADLARVETPKISKEIENRKAKCSKHEATINLIQKSCQGETQALKNAIEFIKNN
jgi:hypothetical protein